MVFIERIFMENKLFELHSFRCRTIIEPLLNSKLINFYHAMTIEKYSVNFIKNVFVSKSRGEKNIAYSISVHCQKRKRTKR
jgi:hypothetical protein